MDNIAVKEVLAFVWHIAQLETVRMSHEYIDPAHVLLSLLQTNRCAAYTLLSDIKAFPSHVYLEIERRMPSEPRFEPSGVSRPISPKVQELWNRVPEMIKARYQKYQVTNVLLLAMLQQEGTLPHAVLTSFGVTEEKIDEWQRQPKLD